MGKRGIVHRASLTLVLIFCKELSTRPFRQRPPSKGKPARAKLNQLGRFRRIPAVRDRGRECRKCGGKRALPLGAIGHRTVQRLRIMTKALAFEKSGLSFVINEFSKRSPQNG